MSRAMSQRGAALCALAAAILCLPSGVASAGSRKPDRTKPVVAFKAPTAGTTVSGSLSGAACEASATDKNGVDRVEFSVDGAALNVDRAAPYNCVWDASGARSGQHTVAARAVDTSGNAATTGVTVSVAAPSPTPTPTPSPTPTPTPTPTPPPAPQVTLTPVDGGADYYGTFANGLSTSPDYFPVGVWGSYNHTQANRDLDAAAGINTYVWVADNLFMPAIRSDGRFRVIQDEGNRTNAGTETAGWLLGDEIDMCCGPPNFAGGNGYDMLTGANTGLPADGKARYTNYGKGVMFWESDADAARFVNLPYLGLVSNDIYWFTDPNERGRAGYRAASSYGNTVARMRFLDGMDGRRKPIWNFVEVGWPFTESAAQGGRSIQPAEVRAAVWHSIIAGARGVLYFQHSFGGPCLGDHHVLRSNCEGTRPIVTSVDAQIKQLAPVLNAPTVTSGTSNAGPIRTMVKWQGGNFYVFAGADAVASTSNVTIPCVGNATATVLGENRSVPVSGGTLTDNFTDPNAVHIYRIDGGSTCGL
jgi:hypothetical protein